MNNWFNFLASLWKRPGWTSFIIGFSNSLSAFCPVTGTNIEACIYNKSKTIEPKHELKMMDYVACFCNNFWWIEGIDSENEDAKVRFMCP